MRRFGFPVVWLLLACLASPASAGEDPLERRMEELRGFFRKDPGEFKTVFHDSFLAAVPPARLKILLASLHAKHGNCTGATLLERKGTHAGVFDTAWPFRDIDHTTFVGLWHRTTKGISLSLAIYLPQAPYSAVSTISKGSAI